jgi:hypothetical protein
VVLPATMVVEGFFSGFFDPPPTQRPAGGFPRLSAAPAMVIPVRHTALAVAASAKVPSPECRYPHGTGALAFSGGSLAAGRAPEVGEMGIPYKRGKFMQVEEFLNVINECDVLRDDIDDIRGRVALSRVESGKLDQAVSHVDKAKAVLSGLFPEIKSLDEDVREDLKAELGEAD